jgi:ADP-ribosyl-[dinitrogen reductase] hydrolase
MTLNSQKHTVLKNKLNGCLIGSIIGDALGSPYEFENKDTYTASYQYATGGTFNLRKGEWTDDTSMSLCAMASITECNKNRL